MEWPKEWTVSVIKIFSSKFTLCVCSVDMVLSPLNIFLLPASTVLSFVSRQHWRDTAVGKGFLISYIKCALSRICPALAVWTPPVVVLALRSGQQQPSASSSTHFSWFQNGDSPEKYLLMNSFPQHPRGGGFSAGSTGKFTQLPLWQLVNHGPALQQSLQLRPGELE